ncbi:MAG: hypothetical protein RSE36_03815 [Oscillospiraceae bacterium]
MKIKNYELSKRLFWMLAALFVALRIILVSQQTMSLAPEVSMLDDTLMYSAAKSISAGNWLGAYSYLAMGKHMLFSVWLALLNALKIPYLLAGQLLYIGACFALVFSFCPILKNRLVRLIFLVYLMYSPASYADFTLRVYRDNITTAVFMLAFAAVIGFAMRSCDARVGKLWGYAVLGGLALGASWLLREDGAWLLPLYIVGFAVSIFYMVKRNATKKLTRFCAAGSVAAIAALCIGSYCAVNYSHYGRFIVSDFTSEEFSDAYGALTRIEAEDEQSLILPVSREARGKLYSISPTFATLEKYLEDESMSQWQKDVGKGEIEYSGGGFYWAVRAAAQLEGYYSNAQSASEFCQRVSEEVNAGLESETENVLPKRSGLNSPLDIKYLLPTLKETLDGFITVAAYGEIETSPQLSTGPDELIGEMERYLHTKAQKAEKVFNDDMRITFYAISENGRVSSTLVDENQDAVSCDTNFSSAGDVYIKYLIDGEALQYAKDCRKTFTYKEQSLPLSIILSCEGEEIVVPAAVTDGVQQKGGIRYCVEYLGKDYVNDVRFSFLEIFLYRVMRVLTWVYSAVNILLTAAAIVLFFAAIALKIKMRGAGEFSFSRAMSFWGALAMLLVAVLRLGMIAFVEVSAFGIGTYAMYLAAVYPALIAFCFASFSFFASERQRAKEQK